MLTFVGHGQCCDADARDNAVWRATEFISSVRSASARQWVAAAGRAVTGGADEPRRRDYKQQRGDHLSLKEGNVVKSVW